MYIASADWMTRNLNRRVEVAFPLYQPDLVEQVRHIIDLQLQDDTKTRDVDNSYVKSDVPTDIRAQYATYEYLRSLVPSGTTAAYQPQEN